jgi:lysophospholipase L1-like esterase
VIFISIKPSRARWDKWPSMRRANALIEELARGDARQLYADIATPMLGDDGKPRGELLIEDGLHLTARGYRVWTDVVAPLIKEALGLRQESGGP